MGQLLSIPVMLAGVYVIYVSSKNSEARRTTVIPSQQNVGNPFSLAPTSEWINQIPVLSDSRQSQEEDSDADKRKGKSEPPNNPIAVDTPG